MCIGIRKRRVKLCSLGQSSQVDHYIRLWMSIVFSSYIEFLSIIITNGKTLSGSSESTENKKGKSMTINEYVQLALQYFSSIVRD